ncbi:MAG TPA: MBL fold metallo-hydrolase [Candidatus Limnocylindrales bacterium]|nr:MBL fold metallo-hydrolase [Candidatus Limnocylindrales bacterium]
MQAAFGDCLVVEIGSPDGPRFLLVDGGPAETYEAHLRPLLSRLAERVPSLDLCVLSHVDNDHVGGLLGFVRELEREGRSAPTIPRIAQLWHNSFAQAVGSAELVPLVERVVRVVGPVVSEMPAFGRVMRGFEEGDELRSAALRLRIPLNRGFPAGQVLVDGSVPIRLGAATVHVIGPSRHVLEDLREEWVRWLARHRDRLRRAAPGAAAAIAADQSVPNLSSICLLVEVGSRSLLLTGDARGDQVLAGLRAAGLLHEGGQRHVSVMKVPHHGSARNVDPAFLRAVPAEIYVVSADGRYGNPDHEALAMIVEVAHESGRPIRLAATNRTASIERLLVSHPPDSFGYRISILRPGRDSFVVDVPARKLRAP